MDIGKKKKRHNMQDGIDEEDVSESIDNFLEANGGEQIESGQCHWVQCDNPDCQKWRRIDYIKDINSLSTEPWTCGMNEDKGKASCLASQETLVSDDEVDCESGHYPGMVVWGKIPGYPWWPCIVDNDPDLDAFYWNESSPTTNKIKTSIHVTFFGSQCTRAWLSLPSIRSMSMDDRICQMGTQRLSKYSFKVRFNGIEYTDSHDEDTLEQSIEQDRDFKNKGKKNIFIQGLKNSTAKSCKQPNTGREKQVLEKRKSEKEKCQKKNASNTPEKKTNCNSMLEINKAAATTSESQESNVIGNLNTGDLPTTKRKEEEFKQRCESWELTKEEFTSVPTLIKPKITPMDEKEISQMAEMMVKSIGDRGRQSSQKLKSSETRDDYQKQAKAKTLQNLKNKCKIENHSKKGGTAQVKSKAVETSKAGMINDANYLKRHSAKVQTAMISRDEKAAVETAKENKKERCLESNAKARASYKNHNAPDISKQTVKDLHKRGNQKGTDDFIHKGVKNSSVERCSELASNTGHHSSLDRQIESKSAKKPLKVKKSGFSVPIKSRLKGGTPTGESNFTVSDKQASQAIAKIDKEKFGALASDKSIKIGNDKIQSACDGSRRELTEKDTSFSNCKNTSSDIDDSYSESRNSTSFVQKHSHCKSRKNNSTALKRKSVGVEYTFQEQTPHSTLKCAGGKDELKETISFQEANEILADSFITNIQMQEHSTDQTYNRLKNSTNENNTSPLVPRNVTDKMQLDEVFKNVHMKSEVICGATESSFEDVEEMDQVIPASRNVDQESDDSSEF